MTRIYLLQASQRNGQILGPSNRPEEDILYRSATQPHSRRRTAGLLARKLGYIRLAPLRYARNPARVDRTQPQQTEGIQAGQTNTAAVFRTQMTSYGGGASQTHRGRIHQRY